VASPFGYLLCGTPRTASTLLCNLLSSTGVLGRPESYFREPDEVAWAKRLGVRTQGRRVRDYRDFVPAVRAAATTDNGVFAARIMWGSLGPLVEGLPHLGGQSDVVTLERALGPLALVHLRREDVFAQAVSWARAEQTGYWQQGDVALRPPEEDLGQMKSLVRTIVEHNAAWESWFDDQGAQPHRVNEQLVQDPRRVVDGIAACVRVDLPEAWQPASPHRRQADATNDKWATALRAALES